MSVLLSISEGNRKRSFMTRTGVLISRENLGGPDADKEVPDVC